MKNVSQKKMTQSLLNLYFQCMWPRRVTEAVRILKRGWRSQRSISLSGRHSFQVLDIFGMSYFCLCSDCSKLAVIWKHLFFLCCGLEFQERSCRKRRALCMLRAEGTALESGFPGRRWKRPTEWRSANHLHLTPPSPISLSPQQSPALSAEQFCWARGKAPPETQLVE